MGCSWYTALTLTHAHTNSAHLVTPKCAYTVCMSTHTHTPTHTHTHTRTHIHTHTHTHTLKFVLTMCTHLDTHLTPI